MPLTTPLAIRDPRTASFLARMRGNVERRSLRLGDDELAPDITVILDAKRRVEAVVRKHERISWDEKRAAFDQMGFKPYPKQIEIASDQHQIRVLRAGRRSGKTLLAAHEAVATMLKKPGSFGWVMGPYFDVTERCWRMIIDVLKKLERQNLIGFERLRDSGSDMYCRLTNGAVCEGRSADTADTNQGVGLDWLIQDEVAQIEPFVFMEVIIPAVIQQEGWCLLIGTPMQDHWASREARKARIQSERTGEACIWAEYIFPTWLNTYEFPGGRFDPKIRLLERTLEPHVFKEQVEAQPQRSPYVVFPEFVEEVHATRCPFNAEAPVVLSIDPGGTNPYAVAVIQDYGARVEMIDEYYESQVIAHDVVNALKARPWWSNVTEAIVDDAAPLEVKTWARHPDVHFHVKRAGKPGYIEDSLPLVKRWLRDPFIYNRLTEPIRDYWVEKLHPGVVWEELTDEEDQKDIRIAVEREVDEHHEILEAASHLFFDKFKCQKAIEEMRGLHVKKPKREERNLPEVPIPNRDHLIDACLVAETRVATWDGDVPIVDVRAGDCVWTRQGWKPVVRQWQSNPCADIVIVHFANGKWLTGTRDHHVWSFTGWIPLGHLRMGHSVQVIPDRDIGESTVRYTGILFNAPMGQAPVYDLEVADAHEYFANGILVSNCRYFLWAHKRHWGQERAEPILAESA